MITMPRDCDAESSAALALHLLCLRKDVEI